MSEPSVSGGAIHVDVEEGDVSKFVAGLQTQMRGVAKSAGKNFAKEFASSATKGLAGQIRSEIQRAIKVATAGATGRIKLQLEVDDSQVRRALAEASRDRKATVEVTEDGAAAAEAKIDAAARDRKTTIEVDADTRSAEAGVERLGNASTRSGSNIRFMTLGLAGIAANVPVIAAAGAAVLSLGAAAATAGSALGVTFAAFHGIGDAVKALGEESEAGAKKTAAASRNIVAQAQAAVSAANAHDALKRATIGVTSAQAALKNAIANATSATRDSARQVAQAQRDIGDAIRGVADAETRLADAQRDARSAQEDLNKARQTALEQIQALKDAAAEGALSEKEAIFALKKARDEAERLKLDPRAGAIEQEEAALRVERAEKNLDDQRKDNTKTAKELSDAQKKGVNGNEGVIAANNRLRDSLREVKDAQQAIKDAQQGVADAERKLADARAGQAETARRNQYSIASAVQSVKFAEMGVTEAQRQVKLQALESKNAIASQVSEVDNVRKAMAGLGPEGQKFARFIYTDVMPALHDLKVAAEDSLLPKVQTAIKNLLPYKNAIKGFVTSVGDATGDVFINFSKALKGPSFKRFFKYVDKTAPEMIRRFGSIGTHVSEILANVFVAAGPAGEKLFKDFDDFLTRIDKWTASPEGQAALKKFFDDAVPVVESLAKLVGSVLKLLGTLATNKAFTGIIDAITGTINAFSDFSAAHPDLVATALWGIFAALVALKGIRIAKSVIGGVRELADAAGAPGRAATRAGNRRSARKTRSRRAFSGLKGTGGIPTLAPGPGSRVRMRGGKVRPGRGPSRLGKIKPGKGGAVAVVAGLAGSTAAGYIGDGKGGKRDLAGNALGGAVTGAGIGATIGSIIPGIGTAIGAAIGGLVGALYGVWQTLGTDTILGFFNGIWQKIKKFGTTIKHWLNDHVVQPVKDFFGIKSPSTKAAGWGRDLIDGFTGGIFSKLLAFGKIIGRWFNNHLVKPVKNFFGIGKADSKFLVIGRVILQAFKDGIWGKLVAFGDNVGTWFNDHLVQPIKNFFGIGKADSKFFQIGKSIMSAMAQGLQSQAKFIANAVRDPLNWALHNVINGGLIDGINKLMYKLLPDKVAKKIQIGHIPEIPRFATGGHVRGPGTATSDSIPALLSDGEYVIKAKSVRAIGVDTLDRLNRSGFDIGGDPGNLWMPAFAGGGLVKSRIDRTKAFLPSVDPLPYHWGAVGPNSYDCSGLVGQIWAMLTGNVTNHRYWTTSQSPAKLGFERGHGAFTIGVNPGVHTAGNLSGLPFEAASTRTGIHVGSKARSVDKFKQQWFLPVVGDQFVGGGSGVGSAGPGSNNGSGDAASGLMSVIGNVTSMARNLGGGGAGKLLSPIFAGALRSVTDRISDSNVGKFFQGLAGKAGVAWDGIKGFFGGVSGKVKNLLHIGDGPSSVSGNQKIVKDMAAQLYNWTGGEWGSLYKLVQGESGFRNTAQNPGSSAFGMFQFLDSTWANMGGRKTSDPHEQTRLGLKYVKSVYGDPINAYGKWSSRSPHWYADGGPITEKILGIGQSTGRRYGFGERGPEYVLNQQQMREATQRGGAPTVEDNSIHVTTDTTHWLTDLRNERRVQELKERVRRR